MRIETGWTVEILERGEWIGPFTVTDNEGRSADHIVLSGPSGLFEHYADEFNTRRIIPLTLAEYIAMPKQELPVEESPVESKVEWPASPIAFTEQELTDVRNRIDIHNLQVALRESGALPFNGVTVTKRITHNCVTPDFLWERMAPSLELRDMDGNIPSYSEFEAYAIQRSHEEFPGTDLHEGIFCDPCDLLRSIWLRYQFTAALQTIDDELVSAYYNDSLLLISLRACIRHELKIAEDVLPNDRPASRNHPAGKDN